MKALRIIHPGSENGIELADAPEPVLGPADILVQVHATALNRADLLQVLGRYPPPPDVPQDIPGLEYAGTVVATGPKGLRFKVGDRVMGLVGGGAFAERLVTQEREALLIPEGLGFEQAAAVPEAFLTAFDALVLQGGLQPHARALIHAVASGVGTAALQLVRDLPRRGPGDGAQRGQAGALPGVGTLSSTACRRRRATLRGPSARPHPGPRRGRRHRLRGWPLPGGVCGLPCVLWPRGRGGDAGRYQGGARPPAAHGKESPGGGDASAEPATRGENRPGSTLRSRRCFRISPPAPCVQWWNGSYRRATSGWRWPTWPPMPPSESRS